MATVTATGLACADCVQVIANDEGTARHRERMRAWLNETPGVPVVTCVGEDTDEDDEDAHHWFSTARCDACGTTLAGDRCPVAWLD